MKEEQVIAAANEICEEVLIRLLDDPDVLSPITVGECVAIIRKHLGEVPDANDS